MCDQKTNIVSLYSVNNSTNFSVIEDKETDNCELHTSVALRRMMMNCSARCIKKRVNL